jgi:hypothetical protein
MYINMEQQRTVAYNCIRLRKIQIEICGAKVELINKTQIA